MKNLHFLWILFLPAVLVAKPVVNNSYWIIGANYSYLNFTPSGDPSFNGSLGGLQAKYEYRPPNRFYAAAELDWRQGSVDGAAGKRSIIDLNLAEKFGFTCSGCKYRSTWYGGFGFQFLRHHLRPSTSDGTFVGSFFPPFIASGTDLEFSYCEFYIPLGFITNYSISSCFSIGLNFEWMPQVFPTVKIGPLAGAYWNLSNKVANFLIEIPFTFNLHKCVFVLSPFYERWQNGGSTAKTSTGSHLGLPSNTYNFVGFDMNLVYRF